MDQSSIERLNPDTDLERLEAAERERVAALLAAIRPALRLCGLERQRPKHFRLGYASPAPDNVSRLYLGIDGVLRRTVQYDCLQFLPLRRWKPSEEYPYYVVLELLIAFSNRLYQDQQGMLYRMQHRKTMLDDSANLPQLLPL